MTAAEADITIADIVTQLLAEQFSGLFQD